MEAPGQFRERYITARVAERIVHTLEVIQIQKKNGERIAIAERAMHFLLESLY